MKYKFYIWFRYELLFKVNVIKSFEMLKNMYEMVVYLSVSKFICKLSFRVLD